MVSPEADLMAMDCPGRDVGIGELGSELMQGNGEVGAFHLAGQDFAQGIVGLAATIHVDVVAFPVAGSEERKALDMIPMDVAQEHVQLGLVLALENGVAEVADAGSGIENHDVSAQIGGKAGGIAAVSHGLFGGGGDAAPDAPEPEFHRL